MSPLARLSRAFRCPHRTFARQILPGLSLQSAFGCAVSTSIEWRRGKLARLQEAIMPALTVDEQLIFDVAVALKKVKIPGFRKGVVEEGRFESAKTVVEYLKAKRWEFSKTRLQ
jgi:hypothetical protein